MNQKNPEPKQSKKARVSLAPLDIKNALFGLLSIPDPGVTKPKLKKDKPKRKKTLPSDKE